MAFDKLPPGTKPTDIPGSRPEDEEFRDILEEVEMDYPEKSKEWQLEKARSIEDNRRSRGRRF